jgi:predicted phosphodiesterase
MVLEFPIMSDYAMLEVNGLSLFATHGHLWSETYPPRMTEGTVLLNGHTHVPACVVHGNYTYINPGSTSIPKGGFAASYGVYEDGMFSVLGFDGEKIL